MNMNHDKPVEELIYELGCDEALLRTYSSMPTLPFCHVQEGYGLFKRKAMKLGLELPDVTKDALNQQFLEDQFAKVEKYIAENKADAMSHIYQCSLVVAPFLLDLFASKKTEIEPEVAPLCLPLLITELRKLGVDIEDQLEEELKGICNNYRDLNFDQDLDSIILRLKKKVCGLGSEISNPLTVHKRSEVDPTRVITDECWSVSLVRLPDRSNSEHAFIVLEGKTGRMSKIWFLDFVAVHWFDAVKPGTEEGKVRMESYESEAVTDRTSGRLLFKCQKRMMDVRASDRLLFSTWLIAKSAAENLIRMIEAQQERPPKYHILGDNSMLAGSSARSSSNPTGHNCFTFAKMMLRELNDPFIELPEDGLETWIGSATSRYLVDKQLRSRKWYKTPSFLLIFGFVTGIVVAYFLFKTF